MCSARTRAGAVDELRVPGSEATQGRLRRRATRTPWLSGLCCRRTLALCVALALLWPVDAVNTTEEGASFKHAPASALTAELRMHRAAVLPASCITVYTRARGKSDVAIILETVVTNSDGSAPWADWWSRLPVAARAWLAYSAPHLSARPALLVTDADK